MANSIYPYYPVSPQRQASLGLFFLIACLTGIPIYGQQTMGILQNESASFNGYTLFGNNETTYLIDNCGYIVNQWESAYKTGHGIYLLNNGDLLRAGSLPGTFDAGGRGGIFELFGWDGQIKWQYQLADNDRHAHHDLAVLPNGHFLATVWERHSEEEAKGKGRKHDGEVWSERIVEIKMSGTNQAEIVWEWSVWDHLIQDVDPAKPAYGMVADHPEKIDLNYIGQNMPSSGNWLHFNAIDYHPKLDQIAVSSRFLSEIWVIDHSTSIPEAASGSGGRYERGGDLLYRYGNAQVYDRGHESDRQLNGQHDIKWIAEGLPFAGSFIVFNNEYVPGTASRVQIFKAPISEDGSYPLEDNKPYGPEKPIWVYSEPGLYSDILSSAQLLPNQNVLICEGRNGYFFEVDPTGKKVWEYINPVNRNGGPGIQGGQPRFNMTFRAIRYAPDHPAFSDKDLYPTVPVELSPKPFDCQIHSLPTATAQPDQGQKADRLKVLGNPFIQTLIIESPFLQEIPAELWSVTGKMLRSWPVHKGINQLDLSQWPNGVYLLTAIIKGVKTTQLLVKQ